MRTLIVGLSFGDCGKGRVSEFYGRSADWFVRFNGGPNAGHTVYHEGNRYALHHLPAGAVYGKKIALDAGMVINYPKLLKELNKVKLSLSDIYISESAHMIHKRHELADSDGSGIGTTKSGIAYAYADKVLRRGVKAKDFFVGSLKTNIYRGLPPIKAGENVIYESAQGIMLDIDYGYYPWVTSSSVFPSSVHKIDKTVGVMKAYTSRVGMGPPSVPEVEGLAIAGDEFGTTTGRQRRCTWLILDDLRYAMSISQPDEIVVTKLDILKDMNIKVWDNGSEVSIGSLDNYKNFLLSTFPQIKYFSESPDGDLISVG